jgi:diaminohydroxyphosphoribosylaminopyrimidine deaminase/5-amino-6-(5-phosphoribosylamino)uracil reductase
MPDAEALMRRALELARRGIPGAYPNPVVGCVLERGGEVVGEGAHLAFGEGHAEANALAAAGERAKGATAYVTLEPCAHREKKTPPCADALVAAGVAKIVWAADDPNPATRGKAAEVFRAAGIACGAGLLEAEARRANAPYFKVHERGLPWVTAKWAMTLDGKIATSSGLSRWITGEAARAVARRMRGEAGCVLVGVGTVQADDPSLAGPPDMRPPLRAVADSSGRIPTGSQIVKGAREVPTFIGVGENAPPPALRALEDAGCRVVRLPSDQRGVDIAAFLRALAPHAPVVFAEGGSHVLGSLFDAGAVDEVAAFIAPSVLGGALAPAPVGGEGKQGPGMAERLVEVRFDPVGEDLLVRGLLKGGYAGRMSATTIPR